MSKGKESSRKERLTFSLSQDSAEFLRSFRETEKSPSLSAGLEKLIERVKRARELAELSASVTAYYDSLSDAEMREQSAWGEIGAEGLAAFESEIEEKTPELTHA